MDLPAYFFRIMLVLSIFFTAAHSLRIIDQESSLVNALLKGLPTAKCDMIVVSSLPFVGKFQIKVQS